MIDDETMRSLADPDLEQHFLTSPTKIRTLLEAADIQAGDQVLELGAGVGTIARNLPVDISLTLVELDSRLADHLISDVPHGRVLIGDAIAAVTTEPFDVLIGSLPNEVTSRLLEMLPLLTFRTAVLAVGEFADLGSLSSSFDWSELTTMSGADFTPPQPEVSRLVRVVPRQR